MNDRFENPSDNETVPANEGKHIDELLAIMRTIQERKDRKEEPVPRDVHPKQHGCIRAELSVEPGLPEAYRRGVFSRERTFAALVRFSNAKQRDDRLPDGHGMAIKLVGVEGLRLLEDECDATTQDFVLIDHPVFFASDAADLVPLMKDFQHLMIGGMTGKLRTVLKAMFSSDHRYRLLRRMGAKRPDNPLEVQYWSTTPIRFGEGAAKFSLLPRIATPPAAVEKSADKLRLAMVAQLRQREAHFDFQVQLRSDDSKMPIEDATVAWDEAAAPFRKVATLRFPIQDFDTPERRNFGENLSFTPWHGISEHRPLGSINRARRKIYETMAARRLELNDVPKREPTLEEVANF